MKLDLFTMFVKLVPSLILKSNNILDSLFFQLQPILYMPKSIERMKKKKLRKILTILVKKMAISLWGECQFG